MPGSAETDYMISSCSAAEEEIKMLTVVVVWNRPLTNLFRYIKQEREANIFPLIIMDAIPIISHLISYNKMKYYENMKNVQNKKH